MGVVMSEDSSAGKQRLGHITKERNSLWLEAAQAAARRHKSIAKVAGQMYKVRHFKNCPGNLIT